MTGAGSEQIAFANLDRARTLLKSGKKEDAKRTLETIVNSYPSTIAAGDAKKILNTFN